MVWTIRKGMLVLIGLLTVSPVLEPTARAQSAAAEAQLTIFLRDADGTPLPNVRFTVQLPQPLADPRGIANVRTGLDGKFTLERLDPEATYVLQFQGGIPLMVNGEQVGSIPVQFADDQNAGRELNAPSDIPGFPVYLGGQTDATLRFVIGGTFSEGESIAAVPMFDLAERDDAPVRPINPLTGDELTPEQARTFHAVIGEPWGVARGGEASTDPAGKLDGTWPVASVDAVPLPSAAAGATAGSSPGAPRGSSPITLVLVGVIVLLAAVIAVLLLRQRRRPG